MFSTTAGEKHVCMIKYSREAKFVFPVSLSGVFLNYWLQFHMTMLLFSCFLYVISFSITVTWNTRNMETPRYIITGFFNRCTHEADSMQNKLVPCSFTYFQQYLQLRYKFYFMYRNASITCLICREFALFSLCSFYSKLQRCMLVNRPREKRSRSLVFDLCISLPLAFLWETHHQMEEIKKQELLKSTMATLSVCVDLVVENCLAPVTLNLYINMFQSCLCP